MSKYKDRIMKIIFFAAACVSILAVALICLFLFVNGFPAMGEIGFFKFLLGKSWQPTNIPASYGILPMILGSIYTTAGAILIGAPIGILTAVFMVWYCPPKWYRVLKSSINFLTGIPSVVYGLFGLTVIAPFIRETFGGTGFSLLTASVLLGIMILPTVVSVTEAAFRGIPKHYYEGGLALGADRERSIFFIALPAAKSGILTAVVLGIGRAMGETMAIVMVAGNQPRMPAGILKGVRTLTTNIVLEMGYAADLHREALVATGVVLFVFILIINLLLSLLKRRTD